jgi:nucleotidyltransferase substrate binding protein (TIGR01987 family)
LGLIQGFEYNYELAWNVMKDFYEAQGEMNIQGSRDAIRLAFKRGLIENGEIWMTMVTSRIMTSHTYNKKIAESIVKQIVDDFYAEFVTLNKKLNLIKAQ